MSQARKDTSTAIITRTRGHCAGRAYYIFIVVSTAMTLSVATFTCGAVGEEEDKEEEGRRGKKERRETREEGGGQRGKGGRGSWCRWRGDPRY